MLRHSVDGVATDVGDGDTTICASLDIGTTSDPVAAIAIRRNFGADISSGSRIGALFVMMISALAILSAT